MSTAPIQAQSTVPGTFQPAPYAHKGTGATHLVASSATYPGHTIDNVGGVPQSRDLVRATIEAVGLTTQASQSPCRAMTDAGECILFKEIPLVYANDQKTLVALNGGTIVRGTAMQRAVLDRGGKIGSVATTFCGDPASQALSEIFYTVGYAGGRAAVSAGALFPSAAIFGQFPSAKLNKATWLEQGGSVAAHNAFNLAALYGGGVISEAYSNMAGAGRQSFLNYLGSYASVAFASGTQHNLSVYAIQLPTGNIERDTVDDCAASCAGLSAAGACGPRDAEITTSDLHVVLYTESFTFHPTGGGVALSGSLYTDATAADALTDF